MSAPDRAALEAALVERHRAGDHEGAAARLVEGYGPEVIGFLAVMVGDRERAQDVFQAVCEDVLKGLPGFRGDASFRTWLYTLARNRAAKSRQRAGGQVPLSRSPSAARLAAQARSATAPYLRTEVKASVRALRQKLSEEERTLLVLRVDRDMDWREIAQIVAPDEGDPARVAARLRKQFQRTKTRLRELATQEGLLVEPEGEDVDGQR